MNNLQGRLFLWAQRHQKTVLVITTNGFQMRGVITGFDHDVIALADDMGKLRMVYKHAISTVALAEKQDEAER